MEPQILCSRCVLDSNVPDIFFDEHGICNYCHQFDRLCADSPLGAEGQKRFDAIVEQMKKEGKSRKYDVLIGISGGSDSSYLIDLAMRYGLRPLPVHLDNGWDSEISIENMRKVLKYHNLEGLVLKSDRQELNALFLAMMKAGIPWIDGPTDNAMVATLYDTAAKNKIRYIWEGHSFRTEGKQPDTWTHIDSRMIRYINKRFGTCRLRHFISMSPWNIFRWWFIYKIKLVRPLNYLDYNKQQVKEMLAQKYDWQDYGGHHHENEFTKFALINWLYPKFGIDKRKITFSACVRSGEMTREVALEKLASPPTSAEDAAENRKKVQQMLELSDESLNALMQVPNRTFMDYPSYWHIYKHCGTVINYVFSKVLCFKPLMSYELQKKGK